MKIRLFIGDRQSQITQMFQTFSAVAKLALGGGEDSKPQPRVVQTEAEAMAFMQSFYT